MFKPGATVFIAAFDLGGCKAGGGVGTINVDIRSAVRSVGNRRELKAPEEIQIGRSMTETLLGDIGGKRYLAATRSLRNPGN